MSKLHTLWYMLYSVYLRPGAVWNETGSVVLVPSWLETDTVTSYSIPGTVSIICWVALPSSWYCWAIVPLEDSINVSVRDSALSSACWWVRDHVTCTWEFVVFVGIDTLTFEGRAGGTVCCVWETGRMSERKVLDWNASTANGKLLLPQLSSHLTTSGP